MKREIVLLGAPSSIGIRPYDDGTIRGLDRAPAVLREQGLVTRLRARDAGDVVPPPYVDVERPGLRPRNEAGMVQYSTALATRVAEAAADGAFVLVLGGDCSIVLGCLLGAQERVGRAGLVYVDAHSDFATPEESTTGSVAAMCAALAVGRGDSPLARLGGQGPLVRETDMALVGRRDGADNDAYGEGALRASSILDLDHEAVRQAGPEHAAKQVLARFDQAGTPGFWIHLDADVLDPSIMPAVDSPEPNGLSVQEIVELLQPLVNHPGALGMQLTIYDPHLDPDGRAGRTIAALLEQTLAPLATA